MDYYSQELEVVLDAVANAGKIITDSFETLKAKDVNVKATNDFVTFVDIEAQNILVSAIRKHFPLDYIIAEETLDTGVNKNLEPRSHRRWFIDPLDGTTNYIHRFPQFATSVALEADGIMVLGVTYDPLKNEVFKAVRGGGAFVNEKPICVSPIEEKGQTLLGTGFPFRARVFLDDYLKVFRYFFNNSRGIRRAGSATLDLAYVAAGRLDAFWELTLSPWDLAAGIVLIEEAGGQVTDFFGEKSYLESGHIIASNGRFHEWMCEEIQKVFPKGGDYSLPEE